MTCLYLDFDGLGKLTRSSHSLKSDRSFQWLHDDSRGSLIDYPAWEPTANWYQIAWIIRMILVFLVPLTSTVLLIYCGIVYCFRYSRNCGEKCCFPGSCTLCMWPDKRIMWPSLLLWWSKFSVPFFRLYSSCCVKILPKLQIRLLMGLCFLISRHFLPPTHTHTRGEKGDIVFGQGPIGDDMTLYCQHDVFLSSFQICRDIIATVQKYESEMVIIFYILYIFTWILDLLVFCFQNCVT